MGKSPLMPVPSFQPRAVIFDLDGTLADNMSWHAMAFDTFVQRHNLPPLTMAMRRRIDGKVNADIMPILFGRPLTTAEIDAYADEKEGTYRELSRGGVRPMPGAPRLLDRLATRGIPAAVATSAPAANVLHTLAELGFADRFAVIARSDEVPRGKPAPDVYLKAAAVLGVRPEACLAFEDAPVGVAAARAAGMRCLAITATFPRETFLTAEWPPHATHPDFESYLADEGRWLL